MMKMKTKNRTPKIIALAVFCLLIGAGIGLLGYHYLVESKFMSAVPSNWQSTKIEPTKELVEKIVFYEDGKQEIIDPKSEDGKGMASLLTRKLHELNLQATCAFSEEDIREIKQKDRVAELIFKKPVDITISQWVEPEERYHIPVDEKDKSWIDGISRLIK